MVNDTKNCQGDTIPTSFLRSRVRDAWEDTWARAGNIQMVNWGDCPIEGSTNKHRRTSMGNTVGVTFSNGDAVANGNQGKHSDQVTYLTLNTAGLILGTTNFNLVHEFGHALGFSHEWRREDWPDPKCDLVENSTVPGTLLTTFPDRDSIMNYDCNRPLPNTISLFPGDIIGVQKAYGRKPTGSLVGFRGMCANIQGGSTANGTPIITFPCSGSSNDTWFRSTTSTFELFTSNSNKCLNVAGGTAPNPIISWSCGNFENERFTTVGVEWRGMGNMCVEDNGSNRLRMKTCNSSLATQKWDFAHPVGGLRRDQIRRNGTNKCVRSQTTSGALGQELELATCSSTDSRQRFLMPGNGRLTLTNNSTLCANVAGGLPKPPDGMPPKVVLWSGCTSTPPYNSQFTLSGQIRSLNHCMATNFGHPAEPILAAACGSNGLFSQTWEYYF